MGKFTAYKLPIKSLPAGKHEFHYELGKQFFVDMENADIRDAHIDVNLTVNHHDDVYELDFTFNGEMTLLCDRCLDDLILPVDTTYHIVVKYGEDYRDDADDFLEIPESDNYLNVAYLMHDTVSLTIPIKHVHPLGKCNRAMSALLKKHRTNNNEDSELTDQLIDEMDHMEEEPQQASDPRWDKLKEISTDE